MRQKIVHSATILTLLGGGPKNSVAVKSAINRFTSVVAADGAANFCIDHDIQPTAVIGDMDSISPETRDILDPETVHNVAEQDSTDFDKCLSNIKAPAILAYGFVGGRLDHTLASCTTLVRHPEQRCIMVGDEDLCFLAPKRLALDLPIGTRFSLFPMGPVTGRSAGLKYPIDELKLTPGDLIGTSNETAGPVQLDFDCRKMLVLLPSRFLDEVLDMLVES